MKTAMYYGPQDVRIEETSVPKIGEDEALVEMKACGVCGSDLMDWYLSSKAPLVLGHEPAGTIAKKGDKVAGFEVGDRVFVHHHVACLKCHYCLRGDYTLCEQFHETNIKPGGFSEYFRVPAPNLKLDTLKIPDAMPYEEATLIEPIGCCIRAIKKCDLQAGDTVAVIGAGATGLIHLALSKLFGASKTFVSDLFEYRLDAARRFGADVAVNPEDEDFVRIVNAETEDRGVDVAIVTAPSLQAYTTAMSICRKGGKLCVFAPTTPGKYLQVSPKELFFNELKIIPSYSTSHLETKEALEMMTFGELNVKDLITHRFKLAETAKAFKTASESNESLKVIVLNE
ncbi:MAG: zinc-dependent dehydrogenase [Candidatus Bathyarchaeia archaeon]|jgi:L-iditol 2-dehydrogenase